jgi:23S rRNA (cytosine1962-C5)-methyltransferase
MFPKLFLRRHEDRRLKDGHQWIFSNEIDGINGTVENGDLIDVYDSAETFFGTGFYNKNSLIAVRLLSHSRFEDIYTLFREKILNAYKLRQAFYPGLESCRLVFSESDFLPGLIIDKYNNTFVLQIYSFGMQKNIEHIIRILKEDFSAENIFTKHEIYFRKLEGLPEEDEVYLGEMKKEVITDGSIKYTVDFNKGQKTGFYFDQRDNRFFIEKIVKGKNVLDAFCNSGGFGLHAVKAGAASVLFVDASETEIENAKKNFKTNRLKGEAEYLVEDVFDSLYRMVGEQKKFDVVLLDPPAFAKSKKTVAIARKGYEKLNKRALQLIEDGFLVTSSCSHHIFRDEFFQIIIDASRKSKRKVQLVYFNGASLDHPELPAMPETTYLKFAVFKVTHEKEDNIATEANPEGA